MRVAVRCRVSTKSTSHNPAKRPILNFVEVALVDVRWGYRKVTRRAVARTGEETTTPYRPQRHRKFNCR